MSAETLRRAAALMRERAEVATVGPWESHSDGRSTELVGDGGADVIYRRVMDLQAPADAEHIASWHPDVALAVADWLDATAERIEAGRDPKHGGRRNHSWRGSREALTVARAYLGEQARVA